MTTGTVFRNHTTQAVRLPKAVAWPDDVKTVSVRVVGASRVLTPTGSVWRDWFAHREPFGDDFLDDRAQGVADEREPW